jgi:hypothetical protein
MFLTKKKSKLTRKATRMRRPKANGKQLEHEEN